VLTYNQWKQKYAVGTQEQLVELTGDAENRLATVKARKAHTDDVLLLVTELTRQEQKARSAANIDGLMKTVEGLEKERKACEQVEEEAANLRGVSRRVVEEETTRLLKEYGNTIKSIYAHLNPHLRLGDLNFRIDSSNPANNRLVFEAMDPRSQVTVNPAYTFSSAQTNVLAISVFLGIALRQQWSNLNALFLDDPIQNMDDINVHSFVDIIRSVVRDTEKQMFISTHDERVFQFMKRKFRENAQVFRFVGYGEFVEE
jgi:hypothetical protein